MKNRIGIVGGGQLGRMMGFEAKKMGHTVVILDPTPNSPAGQVTDQQIIANYTDKKALRELAKISDVLTVEVEINDEEILHTVLQTIIKKGTAVNPPPQALSIIQDKLIQKKFLKKHGIPTPEFMEIKNKNYVLKAAKKYGYPLLLKARTGAYDGRGNVLIKKETDIDSALEKFKGRALYIEKFVPFVKELAIMVARNTKGEIIDYPVVETVHKKNICHIVYAPAPVDKKIADKARKLGIKVMKHLKGAGVFGIEMFVDKKGHVLINEIAPRVHNSGHYTIEACFTSQFEQHIRAITGMPLGSTEMKVPAAVMINILGERMGTAEVSGLNKALKHQGVSVHIYGKSDTKHERKMGHLTAVGKNLKDAYNKAIRARKQIKI